MSNDPMAAVPYSKVVIERLKMAAQASLSPAMLQDLRVESVDPLLTSFSEHLVFQLSTKVAANNHWTQEESDGFDVPASWWDHAKVTLIARWPKLGRWLHPKTKRLTYTRTIRHYRVCPHVQIGTDRSEAVYWLDTGHLPNRGWR